MPSKLFSARTDSAAAVKDLQRHEDRAARQEAARKRDQAAAAAGRGKRAI